MIVNTITDLIGNTPLLKISKKVHGLENIELYAKLELYNPWGSVKDRTAFGIMGPHLDEIKNKRIIESSSGNAAKSLQMLALMNGSSLKTITNRIRVEQSKDFLKLIGVEIKELPGKSDCFDPNDPNDPAFYIQQEIARCKDQYFFSNQYFNDLNRKVHYDTTGQEILDDLGKIDYFIGGLGTTGSTLGTAQRLKKSNPMVKVIGIVSEGDDYIPGIRTRDELFEVGLFESNFYDEIISVTSKDSLESMMLLVRNDGLLAGPTTGAALFGGLNYLRSIDENLTETKKAVFIACDRMEGYVSYIKERRSDWFNEDVVSSWKDDLSEFNNDIGIDRAESWIAENLPLIVDIRQPISFKTAHIPNSINIPFDYLSSMLETTNPFCTKQKILLVCPLGEKSALIAAYLKTKSVDAYNLRGGINEWREHAQRLERDL